MRRILAIQSRLSNQTMRRGFTLVELIVVISALGILMAILLPALRSARGAAIDAKALSNVRQDVLELFAYAADHDGKAPRAALMQPDQPFPLPLFGPDAIFIHPTHPEVRLVVGYFAQANRWDLVLLLAGHPPSEAWHSPTTRLKISSLEQLGSFVSFVSFGSWYTMSAAYLADPEYWRVGSHQDTSSWRAVRLDETAYPSAKALLFNPRKSLRLVKPTVRSVVGFADGHGQWRKLADARLPVPLTNMWAGGIYDEYGIPLFTTREGVLGRDF